MTNFEKIKSMTLEEMAYFLDVVTAFCGQALEWREIF